jgi:hypothetical protein
MTSLREEQFDVIVASVLAVNRFPLLRAQELVPHLRFAGLLDPEVVLAMDIQSVTNRLAATGYDRGALTVMFARRLVALVKALHDKTLDPVVSALKRNEEKLAIAALTSIEGVGPVVARTAWHILKIIGRGDREPT